MGCGTSAEAPKDESREQHQLETLAFLEAANAESGKINALLKKTNSELEAKLVASEQKCSDLADKCASLMKTNADFAAKFVASEKKRTDLENALQEMKEKAFQKHPQAVTSSSGHDDIFAIRILTASGEAVELNDLRPQQQFRTLHATVVDRFGIDKGLSCSLCLDDYVFGPMNFESSLRDLGIKGDSQLMLIKEEEDLTKCRNLDGLCASFGMESVCGERCESCSGIKHNWPYYDNTWNKHHGTCYDCKLMCTHRFNRKRATGQCEICQMYACQHEEADEHCCCLQCGKLHAFTKGHSDTCARQCQEQVQPRGHPNSQTKRTHSVNPHLCSIIHLTVVVDRNCPPHL